jgi:adenylylsulfate kinase
VTATAAAAAGTGVVVWFTGLPGSGKSTLAGAVRERLADTGVTAAVLDGDEVRACLGLEAAHDEAARARLYRGLGRLAAMLARQGLVVLVPATAHRRAFRAEARALAPRFLEVHVATPAATCAARDPKGLWAAASAGKVTSLPGMGVAYEPPEAADVVASGGQDEAAIAALVDGIVGPRV